MERRAFLTGLIVAVATSPRGSNAQAERIKRIGFLRVGSPPTAFIENFRKGLQQYGLVEDRNVVIDFAIVPNSTQVLRAATDLVDRKVDVMVASGTPSVLPARDAAAGKIPLVFIATLDPVAAGLVISLSRPGGNVTGMTSISGDLIAKRLELIRELLPKANKIAILVRESSPTTAQYVRESLAAGRNLGVEVQILVERSPDDLEGILAIAKESTALVVADDAEFTAERTRLAQLALQHRLPLISGLRELVEAGALLAYGANFGELYRRAASHVYRILQGASPADLPVEQPAKLELALNMRTAKALGLVIPSSLLARADDVIE